LTVDKHISYSDRSCIAEEFNIIMQSDIVLSINIIIFKFMAHKKKI